MVNRQILESHPVSVLKKEISATNIKGYSKMKKSEVIDLMLKKEHREKFSHIKSAEGKKKAEPKEITIVPKRKIKPERAKKISAPAEYGRKAFPSVIRPKPRVALIPKVIKAKPTPKPKAEKKKKAETTNNLSSNRDLVQALLDGATNLLPQRHINNPNSLGKRTDTMELLEKIKKSPALRKKLLDFKFRDNLYDEINTLVNRRFMKLQQNLGRDTATGKLKTVETSSRPKAVRELKEFMALPLWRKLDIETAEVNNNKWGKKTQTGRALYNAMAEIVSTGIEK